MIQDIGPIMQQWTYHPNDINVRLIEGADGMQKIQLRLDLGILQMELDGRPDGKRPHGFDSYLSHFEHRIQLAAEDSSQKVFHLSPMNCLHLQQESVQYYHRYLALMKLNDYPRVARDTALNLRLFDLVVVHSADDEITWSFEQYRPYVVMMNTRAKASMNLANKEYDEALRIIDEGVAQIQQFHLKYKDRLEHRGIEIDFLHRLALEINELKPVSIREKLQRELDQAVDNEDYERAAAIRDQLRQGE